MTQDLDTTAGKTVLTIQDLQSRLGPRSEIKFTYIHDLENSEQLQSVQEAMEVIAHYQTPGILESTPPQNIREDLTRLAALNVLIGQMTGVIQSHAQNAEEAVKLDRAKTHLQLKELKEELESQGQRVRASEKDIEAVARVRASDIIEIMKESRTTGEYAKFCYYAIAEFTKVLQSAASRILFAENQNVQIS